MANQFLGVVGVQLMKVDTQNDFFPKNLFMDWKDAVGAVNVNNQIVIVCEDGTIWTISADAETAYKEVPIEIELGLIKTVVSYGGSMYAFCENGSLYHIKIRRGRAVANELSKGWENVFAATHANGKLFVTTDSGQLLMVNPEDGSSSVLCTDGWKGVQAIVGFGSEIYAISEKTFKIDIFEPESRIPVDEEHKWTNVPRNGATCNTHIYVLDSEYLWEINMETELAEKKDEAGMFYYPGGKFVFPFPNPGELSRDPDEEDAVEDENENAGKVPDKDDLILICYNPKNGAEVAKLIQTEVQKLVHQNQVRLLVEPGDPFDAKQAEEAVKKSTCLISVLTADALKQPEVVLPMTAANDFYIHKSLVILVHDAESCFFPGTEEQPLHLQEFFSEKAVTFLSCYAAEGAFEIAGKFYREKQAMQAALVHKNELVRDVKKKFPPPIDAKEFQLFLKECNQKSEIALPESKLTELFDSLVSGSVIDLEKLQEGIFRSQELYTIIADGLEGTEVHEDLTTRLFLSHKRSSGQAIVGRLYEGLKDEYSIFLDSEAKFKIHNLRKIVENTVCVVFVLSAGIFQSRWCLEELKSAVEYEKQIIVVRDLFFKFPEELPEEWKPYEAILRTKDYLVWMAEYNTACVNAIKRRLGAKDSIYFREIHPIREWFRIGNGKAWLEKVKQTGELVGSEGVEELLFENEIRLCAALPYLQNLPQVHTASFREISSYSSAVDVCSTLLNHLKKELPNLKKLSLQRLYQVNQFYPDWIITKTENNRVTFQSPDQPHNVEELSFIDLPADQIKQLPKELKKLTLWTRWFKPEAQHVQNVIESCPNLTHFTAYQLEFGDTEKLFAQAFPNLEYLRLRSGSGFSNNWSWVEYFKSHPNLHKLLFQGWYIGNPEEFFPNAKHLTTLELDSGVLSLDHIKMIADEYSDLEELTLAGSVFWDIKDDDDMLLVLASGKFPKLRKLALGATSRNPIFGPAQLKIISSICGNLTYFALRTATRENIDEALIEIFSKCAKTLTTVELPDQYTYEEVKNWLAKNCPNVQILTAQKVYG